MACPRAPVFLAIGLCVASLAGCAAVDAPALPPGFDADGLAVGVGGKRDGWTRWSSALKGLVSAGDRVDTTLAAETFDGHAVWLGAGDRLRAEVIASDYGVVVAYGPYAGDRADLWGAARDWAVTLWRAEREGKKRPHGATLELTADESGYYLLLVGSPWARAEPFSYKLTLSCASGTCAMFEAPLDTGRVTAGALDEASGLAASTDHRGVLWAHNDSGDEARVFALDRGGALLGEQRLTIAGRAVAAHDFEDIAIGSGYLYVGDIGDNDEERSSVTVYRFAEPRPDLSADVEATAIELRYPRPENAESLMVDPSSGDLFIATKHAHTSDSGKKGTVRVHVARADALAHGSAELTPLAELRLGKHLLEDAEDRAATAGDISPAADELVLRSRREAFLWFRPRGLSWAGALATRPLRLPLADEPQGEAIAFAGDGRGLFTLSEGEQQPLRLYRRR